MDLALTLAPILAVLVIGVVSPGPSFILVARTAVALSRPAALSSALGMGVGAAVLALAALLGLNMLLQQIPGAYLALKVSGGLYLVWLAWKTWRGARLPIRVADTAAVLPASRLRHFGLAAATMLSNPKAAVQYGVIFAAMLPRDPSAALMLVLPASVFALEAGWYTLVALALSAPRPRAAYLRAKTGIDRVAGALLAALGIKLLFASR